VYYSDIFIVLSGILSVVQSVSSHGNELLKVLKYGSPTRGPPGSIMRPAATYANYRQFCVPRTVTFSYAARETPPVVTVCHKMAGHPHVKRKLSWPNLRYVPACVGPEENWSQYTAVSAATRLISDLSLLQNVQTGCGAHPASYSIGTGGSSSAGKADGAW